MRRQAREREGPLMKPVLERFKFDDDYIRRLKAGDEDVTVHFVSHFGTLLEIKLRNRVVSPQHIGDIRHETLVRVLAALRSEPLIRHPERLGEVVNETCNRLLRNFHGFSGETNESSPRRPLTTGVANMKAVLSRNIWQQMLSLFGRKRLQGNDAPPNLATIARITLAVLKSSPQG
jgi:hypothetical protein